MGLLYLVTRYGSELFQGNVCVCVMNQSNIVHNAIRQLYVYTHTIGCMLHYIPGAKLYSYAVLVLLQSRYRGILNIPPILRYLFPLLPDVVTYMTGKRINSSAAMMLSAAINPVLHPQNLFLLRAMILSL